MRSLTIHIPEDLKQQLELLCKQQDRLISEVVRDALRRYVVAETFQGLRCKTLPFAQAHGFLTDDDAFNAIS